MPGSGGDLVFFLIDGWRSLRPLSPRQHRFTPNVTGFASESPTDFSSESLTALVGIRTYTLTLFGGRRFNLGREMRRVKPGR
jgi:hypothetical protein